MEKQCEAGRQGSRNRNVRSIDDNARHYTVCLLVRRQDGSDQTLQRCRLFGLDGLIETLWKRECVRTGERAESVSYDRNQLLRGICRALSKRYDATGHRE